MRLPFPNDLTRIDGALGIVQTARGISPRRLPPSAESRVFDPMLDFDVAATAGVRVAFATTSPTIAMTLVCDALQLNDSLFPVAVDICVDGAFAQRRDVVHHGAIHHSADAPPTRAGGPPVTITFDGLGDHEKQIEIWLPHTASSELISLETTGPIRLPRERLRSVWIHHGSSISHCLESPFPTDCWPARVARELDLDLVNLGFAGQALLDPFVGRAISDAPADFVSLELGINIVADRMMRERTFRSAVDGFLDLIREGHPSTPVLVVSAIHSPRFDSSAADNDLTLGRSRDVLRQVVDRRISEGDNITYMDGQLLLGREEAIDVPDGVHPRPTAYSRIAERFAAQSTRLIPRRT